MPPSEPQIFVLGVGDDGFEGLSRHAVELLQKAKLVLGPAVLLDRLPSTIQAKREVLSADLDKIIARLNQAEALPVVVLATGDPLFYGTARFLCDRLGKDRFEVVPHVSSMQLAFARVKESWDEAYLSNLATQSLDRVVEKVRTAEKVGLFTTDQVTPELVAEALLKRGIDYFTVYVCENLGSRDERVTRGSLEEIAKEKFAALNVMVLIRKALVPDRPVAMQGRRLFGNPDERFLHSRPNRGLVTPAEVRAIALSELDLGPESIVWDVGAGSGSVAIEAAQIAASGTVYAIEMDAEDYNLLIENSRRFGTSNVQPVLGEAPKAWNGLPDPDCIFVGGTGRAVSELVEAAWGRLKPSGRLVVNVTSLEYLVTLQNLLLGWQLDPATRMIQLARSNYQLDRFRLESSNPTFLVSVSKPA